MFTATVCMSNTISLDAISRGIHMLNLGPLFPYSRYCNRNLGILKSTYFEACISRSMFISKPVYLCRYIHGLMLHWDLGGDN